MDSFELLLDLTNVHSKQDVLELINYFVFLYNNFVYDILHIP